MRFSPRAIAALTTALTGLGLAVVLSPSANAALEAPPTVYSVAPAPDQPGWTTSFAAKPSELLRQGPGQQPVAVGGMAVYSIASSTSPTRVARSENDWAATRAGASLTGAAGDRMRVSFVVQPTLGDSPMDDSGWIVVAQAQGPVGTPGTYQWIEPGFSLAIRDGAWRVTGGDWGRGNQWYNLGLAPYVDGKAVKVRMDVLLGAGKAGAMTVWLDDVLVVDRSGITTMQPDAWAGMRLRTGLYAGEQGSTPAPTYARSVAVRDLTISVARRNG